jgi:hypothetical protein
MKRLLWLLALIPLIALAATYGPVSYTTATQDVTGPGAGQRVQVITVGVYTSYSCDAGDTLDYGFIAYRVPNGNGAPVFLCSNGVAYGICDNSFGNSTQSDTVQCTATADFNATDTLRIVHSCNIGGWQTGSCYFTTGGSIQYTYIDSLQYGTAYFQ